MAQDAPVDTDFPVDSEPPPYASLHEASLEAERNGGPSKSLPDDLVFDINVSDPVKQGEGVNAHVSYRVSTTTNLPQYRWSEFSVIRRFSDFVWLRARLGEKHRGTVIPPLPEKGVATKVFTISADFIEARRRALVTFLQQVSHHPALCFSQDLQFFLEASEESWSEQKAKLAQEAGAAHKPLSNFGKMVNDFTSKLGSGSSKVDYKESLEQLKLQEYYSNSTAHTADVQRQAERLLRKQKDLGVAIMEAGEAFETLGSCESGELKQAFEKALDVQAGDLSVNFGEPMKSATRHLKAVQEVMADRESCWEATSTAKDEVQRLDARISKLKMTNGKPAAIDEAERARGEAQRKAGTSAEEYEFILTQLKTELARFQTDRSADFKKSLADFALSQATVSIDLARNWQELIPVMDSAAAAHMHPSQKEGGGSPSPGGGASSSRIGG